MIFILISPGIMSLVDDLYTLRPGMINVWMIFIPVVLVDQHHGCPSYLQV